MKSWCWLQAVFLGFFWSLGDVQAATVAVLDFDGYGVTHDDAAWVSQGLRDAFLETSWLPLSDFDISDRLSVDHETDISSARRLVSDARKALDRGQASTALSKLRQAEQLHRASGSDIGRRPELADVLFFQAKASLNLGRRSDAKKALVECLYLYPGYPDERAPSMGSSQRSLFDEAQQAIEAAPRRVLNSAEASRLQDRLAVDAVVIGYLASDGTVFARLTRGTVISAEVKKVASEVPPFPGEPIYGQLVRGLVGEGSGNALSLEGGSSGEFPSSSARSPDPYTSGGNGGGGDFDDLPDFEDEPDSEPDRGPASSDSSVSIRSPKTDPLPPESEERESGFVTSTSKDARIRSTGRMKYDDSPITHRPWFWGIVVGGLAAGGGVAAIIALSESDGNDTGDGGTGSGPTSYTVTVESGG